MTFILKTTEHAGPTSPVGADNEHCLYSDVVTISFQRLEGGAAIAHCYLREPVKTAEVPGFCEVEKFISFTGTAYVMNETGKTVSTFTARTSGRGNRQDGTPDDCTKAREPSNSALGDLPYETVAAIRRAARAAGDLGLTTILDYARVAVDA